MFCQILAILGVSESLLLFQKLESINTFYPDGRYRVIPVILTSFTVSIAYPDQEFQKQISLNFPFLEKSKHQEKSELC